jgi:NAD(P)H-nitrite reductase large subunit
MEQAYVAASNLLGGGLRYAGGVPPAKLKVPEIDLLSVGETEALSESARELRFDDRNPRRYRKHVLRDGKVCGRHPHRTWGIERARNSSRRG